MNKPKTKAKKPKVTKSLLYATKTKRCGKGVAWMPNEVVVKMTGEKTGKLLITAGWSIDAGDEAWPTSRIEVNLGRLSDEWVQDFGKGWKLEIRPISAVSS
jgi:hypothetical protein